MKLKLLPDLNNYETPPQISFNPDPIVWKKTNENQYSLKVEIKTQ